MTNEDFTTEQDERLNDNLKLEEIINPENVELDIADSEEVENIEQMKVNKYTNIVLEPKTEEYIKQLEKENGYIRCNSTEEEIVENQQLLKKKADEDNDIIAANTLAVTYYTSNNTDEAIKYFEKAVEQNYSPAKRNLAIVLESRGDADLVKIFNLYKEASENDAIALNNLGCCYIKGEGTEIYAKKAVECFKLAAKKNDELSKINLGDCYALGVGISKNLKNAYKCYRKAAEVGNTIALNRVAECYLNGLGTEKNIENAIKCYELVLKNGDKESAKKIKEIKEKTPYEKHKIIELNKSKELTNNKNRKQARR